MRKIPDQILGLSPTPNDVPADWMTARDHFAMAALQGILAAPEEPGSCGFKDPWKALSENAYKFADAMLAARVNGVDER